MLFPVVMYRCESWIIRKAEHRRIDAFELWCWSRLLRVPWTAWISNHSILKKINPEYSLEELMLKLKLQYFGHLMWGTNSLEKTLMLGMIKAGGEGDNTGWDGCVTSPTWWTWVWASSGSWWWTGKPGMLQSTGSQSQIRLSNWTELMSGTRVTLAKFWIALVTNGFKETSLLGKRNNSCVSGGRLQGRKRIRKLTIWTLLVNGLSTSVIEESSQKTNTKTLKRH